MVGVKGIPSVAVKCVDIGKNTDGESTLLGQYWHWETRAKGANGIRYPGSLSRKRWILSGTEGTAKVNTLSIPPGEYACKSETQRNWRGPAQAVEHVV